MSTLQDVLYEWQNNLKFREEFKKDPQKALQAVNLQLSQEDLTKIIAMLTLKENNDDEDLDERISK